DHVVRLVLLGSCETGKTCLLRRFLGGYFEDGEDSDYTRTLGVDFGCKTVELADRRVRLQIWDTGGSVQYRSVVSHYLHGADGVALCFDVTNKSFLQPCVSRMQASLEELPEVWVPLLKEHAPSGCRLILLGNKVDVLSARHVAPEDSFASSIGVLSLEVSAKDGSNVDLAITGLMRDVLHHRTSDTAEEGERR
ncbi:unnamed protein product, partial [Discosporangium mesarthrocarpum]